MGIPLLSGKINVIGKEIVDAKLLAAEPAILANNRAMVTEMLRVVKDTVAGETPLGPGRDGHLRSQYTTEVSSKGLYTTGVLKAPPKGYWYEFGTGQRYRGRNKLARYVRSFSASTGGEKAHLLATRAASTLKRYLTAYYGGAARWWGSPRV